jgi:hypothetical protein
MEPHTERLEANQEELEANKEKIEPISEPYKWVPHVKATHLLTALQGHASGVLRGVSKEVTYD